jgi:hypothetical protein
MLADQYQQNADGHKTVVLSGRENLSWNSGVWTHITLETMLKDRRATK